MYTATSASALVGAPAPALGLVAAQPAASCWFALCAPPRNEKSVARALEQRGISVFLPTYLTHRLWKNRQRVSLELPLFAGYLFVHIHAEQRSRVLSATHGLRFVGNAKGPLPIPAAEIECLRLKHDTQSWVPYNDLVIGQQVRIRRGALAGVQGVLVRKNNDVRFVVTINLINQHVATIVEAADLEPIPA